MDLLDTTAILSLVCAGLLNRLSIISLRRRITNLEAAIAEKANGSGPAASLPSHQSSAPARPQSPTAGPGSAKELRREVWGQEQLVKLQ